MMAAVNRAYSILSDPEQRAEYDQSRAAQSSGTRASNPSADTSSQTSRPQSNAPQDPTGYFTLGSTKSDVADIHGPPSDVSVDRHLREEVWHYGSNDTIEFDLDTGRVQGWSNIRGNLRIRLVPGQNVTTAGLFTIGSHRDDVARLHGTPPVLLVRQEEDWENWMYPGMMPDINHVEFSFSTGRVTSWENRDGLLKVRGSGVAPGSGASSGRTRRTSNWRTLSNEYNDVSIYTADPIDPDSGLIVRFKDRELGLYVTWGTEISYSEKATVNYQIDNGPTWRQSWNVSANRKGTFMPSQDIAENIRALFDAEQFIVRVYPFGGNPLTASFQVSGFREAVGPVLEAWRRSGSPAPGVAAQGGGCALLPVGALGTAAVATSIIWLLL